MKKVFSTFLLMGLLLPTITEAGFSPEGKFEKPRDFLPEGKPRKPKCKNNGSVVGCRVPKLKKCRPKNPCTPPGYYRPNPPMPVPMGWF